MMHFFRKPKIHIDCLTARRDVIEYAPIVNAIEVIPDWWKKLPKKRTAHFFPMPTMKTCVGMYDYYARSIAMPLWSELCVKIAEDKSYVWQFSDGATEARPHDPNEYTGFLDTASHGHLKLLSPWALYTKEDIPWVLSEPIYNRKNITDYVVAQGVLNFYKQHSTNIQLFLDAKKPNQFILPFGTPFLFTPLSDKKIVIHRQLVSKEEMASRKEKSSNITFINKYKTQQKINKCPYKDFLK